MGKIHSYKPWHRRSLFSAWLFRIARHAVIDAYRSQRGFEEVSEDLVDEDVWNDPMATMERQLSVKPCATPFRNFRATIAKSCFFIMFELSHAEVAKALKLTEGFVRVLTSGPQNLRSFLSRLPHPGDEVPSRITS